MHNLLSDPLIRVRLVDGTSTMLSLPEVYEALAADGVAAFSALRPHQRHAWHAFLAQLGVIAVQRAGETAPPRTAGEWGALLRGLTPEFSDSNRGSCSWTIRRSLPSCSVRRRTRCDRIAAG